MTETVLGLLRHGQTDWNITFRIQGSSDIPLNETGIAQAHTAAEVIDGSEWDVIIASPLSRALHTAQIVANRHGFENVEIEPLLTERSFGEAEGMEYSEWKAGHTDHALIPGIRAWSVCPAFHSVYSMPSASPNERSVSSGSTSTFSNPWRLATI